VGEIRNTHRILIRKLEGINHLGRLGVDERIILNNRNTVGHCPLSEVYLI
jgi:hypothetical protein